MHFGRLLERTEPNLMHFKLGSRVNRHYLYFILSLHSFTNVHLCYNLIEGVFLH